MLDPETLFEVLPDEPEFDRPVLIQALDGFVDAGGGRALARQHLLDTFENKVIARFDVDQILDYRARRPLMIFDRDHWESYTDPELVVRQLRDASGTTFLMLDGPEPDVQWERFVAAVQGLVERWDVRLVVGLNSIPMQVPHTRPVGMINHATRPELLLDTPRAWFDKVPVPASVGQLLEYRLGQVGRDAIGATAQVPHYLSQTEYPAAAVALLEATATFSGLSLPTDALRTAAAETRKSVDNQVADSPQAAGVVEALESQYDAFMEGQGRTLLAEQGQLPTAEELGDELEQFLRDQTGHGSAGGDPRG